RRQAEVQGSVSPKWLPPTGTLGLLTKAAEARANALVSTLPELRALALDRAAALPFATNLRGDSIRLITEIKRFSPSKGAIAVGLNAVDQARHYVAGGAAAISVLTEPEKFGGTLSDLDDVSSAVAVPTLRKDFIVHPVQLWEARANGASAVLLIVRSLSPSALDELMQTARDCGLETLVEVRDELELERALNAGARVVGVNNRNLETLEIDVTVAPRIIAHIPSHVIAVAESGMSVLADLNAPAKAGADAALIGSSISAASDPEAAVRALASVARVERPQTH
ncbi:MAG: indole-3-glycerol phosphate synthase TrpC, partial [Gemmatimonadaceae bacterium]